MARKSREGMLGERVLVGMKEVLAAGVSRRALARAVELGRLMRVVPPGGTYGKFRRKAVVRVFGLAGEGEERRGDSE